MLNRITKREVIKMVFVMFFTTLVLLSTKTVNVQAVENVAEEGNNEYITFASNGKSRIYSDGTFTFGIVNVVSSDLFTANSDTISINTQAYVKGKDGTKYTDSNVSFNVYLFNSWGVTIGGYTAYCDGIYGGCTFNVNKGSTYYIKIGTGYNFKDTGCSITGKGDISNITVD